MKKLYWTIVFACLWFNVPAQAEEWRMVYADDFNRQEVGPSWFLRSPGSLSIEAGELTVDGCAEAIFRQPVPGDQKIEWDTRFLPGQGERLVQFAASLKGSPFKTGGTGVVTIHGMISNTRNWILFMGFENLLAENDAPLPKAGVTYHCEAAVEGTNVYMKVNGKTIISAVMPMEPNSPLMDYVSLAGYNRLIRIDNVKIYTKNSPPVLQRAMIELPVRYRTDGGLEFTGADPDGEIAAVTTLMNSHKPVEALARAGQIKDGRRRLDALMMLAKDLDAPNYPPICQAVVRLLREQPNLEPPRLPGAPTLEEIASQMAAIVTDSKRQDRAGRTLYLKPRLDSRHPFYNRMLLNYAKALYWEGQESHYVPIEREAERALIELLNAVSDLAIARIYLGEKVPWGQEFVTFDPQTPAWAQAIRETYARALYIVRWWGEHRQSASGELGGGWGDDVEILRNWGPLATIGDCDPGVAATLKRLIDGAWKYAEGGLTNGYTKLMSDVEHTAEPMGDTQPLMLGFESDNPEYVQRNMKVLPLVRDRWTAFSPKGYRRFKSVWFTADEVLDDPTLHVSVPYNTRAYKSLTWLLWQGNYPEVKKVWLELADGWREATMREEGGKLAGVAPAGVACTNDRLGGLFGSWYSPKQSETMYDWTFKYNQRRIMEMMVMAYEQTGDLKYMEPVFKAFALMQSYRPCEGYTPPIGSADWQKYMLYTWDQEGMWEEGFFGPLLLRYQRDSGDKRFEAYLKNCPHDSVVRYQFQEEPAPIVSSFTGILEQTLRYNLPLMTAEPQSTDRVNLPGAHTLYRVMTGASGHWSEAFGPDHAVTWSHKSPAFAAMVRYSQPGQVQIRFYNFDEKDPAFAMKLWSLPHGKYTVSWTAAGETQTHSQTVDYRHLGQRVEFEFPANREIKIEINAAPATETAK